MTNHASSAFHNCRRTAARSRSLATLVALTLSVTAGGALVGAPVASASGADVIRDCVAVALKPHYPALDYEDALANMPNDVDEYTACRSEILAARALDVARQSGATGKRGAAARAQSGTAASPLRPLPIPSERSVGSGRTEEKPKDDAPKPTSAPIAFEDFDGPLPSDLEGFPAPVAGPAIAETKRQAPLVPIVIAFVIVIATGASLLARWSRSRNGGGAVTS